MDWLAAVSHRVPALCDTQDVGLPRAGGQGYTFTRGQSSGPGVPTPTFQERMGRGLEPEPGLKNQN